MNFPFPRLALGTLLVVLAAGLSSCATRKSSKSQYSTRFDPKVEAVKNPSAVKVKISTKAQRIYVVEGDRVLLASPCSVGTANSPTPAGHHRILSKTAQRRRVSQPGAGLCARILWRPQVAEAQPVGRQMTGSDEAGQ